MKVGEGVSDLAGDRTAAGRLLAMSGIYSLLAEVLDYPGPKFSAQVQDLISQLPVSNSETAQFVREFQSELRDTSLGELQELYTTTFDMRPDRTTNLGCHLFGEDVRRNLFMAHLKERMEAHEIPMGCELPDHMSLILRLLASEESEEEAQTLIADCLMPAVTRILSTFEENAGPNLYVNALRALLAVLATGRQAEEIQAST